MQASEAAAREFIARINRHDVEGIVASCTADHRFIDSLGHVLIGRERLREAWTGYLELFPDYAIEVESLAVSGARVLAAGSASATAAAGTPREQHWRIPAAWRAQVRDGLVECGRVNTTTQPTVTH